MRIRTIVGAAVVAGAVLGTPSAAFATADYVGTQVEVEGVEFTRAPEPVAVLGVQASREGATLPVTGGDLVGMALFGATAVALGTVLVRRGRTASVTA